MRVVLESNDRDFLVRLQRLGQGTIQQLCEDLGVTATAVRQRLMRLQSLGMVTREVVRAGRGRPRHIYCVTESGIRELGDNYSELATVLWFELSSIDDREVRAQVFHRIQNALVARYGSNVQGESLQDRIEQLCDALVDRGFDVEVDVSGDLPILRENNCPYLELASSHPEICELERSVFKRILGVDVSLEQCCLDGHHCCEFHAESGSDDSESCDRKNQKKSEASAELTVSGDRWKSKTVTAD